MIDGPISYVRGRISLALKSLAGGAVAAGAGLVALCFFCAAAFIWMQRTFDAITACLVLGGVFLVIALVALIVMLVLRRKAAERAQAAASRANLWTDPRILAAGIEMSRAFGGRRVISMALIGAFIVGLLLNRPKPKD